MPDLELYCKSPIGPDDGTILEALDDYLIIAKTLPFTVDVLSNDTVPTEKRFEHSTTIHATGETDTKVMTINGKKGDYFYWFKSLSGTSTISIGEDATESHVSMEGFEFQEDLGRHLFSFAGCGSGEQVQTQWARWTGGRVTIQNEFGTTVFEGVTFTGGVAIDAKSKKAKLGQATGRFTSSDGALAIDLPEFDGTQGSVTSSGLGKLSFTRQAKLEIVSQPTGGTAAVINGQIHVVPNLGTDGTHKMEYRLITQIGEVDTASIYVGSSDLDLYTPDGTLLSEAAEDNPGLYLARIDDSNLDQDTLSKLSIREYAFAESGGLAGYFTLSFDSTVVTLWHDSDRTIPDNHETAHVISDETLFYIDDDFEDFEVWIEGTGIGSTQIHLTWTDFYNKTTAAIDDVSIKVVRVPRPQVDIDTDSDNSGTVDRTEIEEQVEDDHSAIGKRIFTFSSAPAQVVIDANADAVESLESGSRFVLVVSAGLNLWSDYTKTTRPSSDFSQIPEDDTLDESYIFRNEWPATTVFYVEGTAVGESYIYWTLESSDGSVLHSDSVKFNIERRNQIFISIDGTSSEPWLDSNNGRTPENPNRWNSHVRNIHEEMDQLVEYSFYQNGPNDFALGNDSPMIKEAAFQFAVGAYEKSGRSATIALVGWSRGGAIALWVANELSDRGIPVNFVGLYDPVDMAHSIPDSEALVAPLIDRVTVVGPYPNAANLDYHTFERMVWSEKNVLGLRTGIPYIRPEDGNSRSLIAPFLLNASHGSIGGTPGYNDSSFWGWGEDWNAHYNYNVDRMNSILADQIIRTGLRSQGWDVSFISDDDYGFPLQNPTA